ncbi:hypothetical protein [Psychromonas sp. SR45-3]|uniref:hypothetical protein n=1 Tax=Psychromonas sp. SR45-3 TaxID=2760930 RepID=UPI0015FADAC2|nr:hypothetical protein [Psychromonas sp. SR45-3]MBB1273078.1 hypothetical protein [Psychromonas sp. SR45-3]
MKKSYPTWTVFSASCLLSLPLFVFTNMAEAAFLGENSRVSIDMSSRVSSNLDTQNHAFMHVLGIDIHKVFSSDTGDIGTLILQPYVVKLNNVNNPPFIFDDGNATKLTWRIANFNYTALNQGKFNIRLGHFEVPFGLEYQIDTNGTLRQLTAIERGIKADWGVSINGIMPRFEYEVALTQGSGAEINNNDDSHLFSGRIGTLSTKNIVTGLSWLSGDILAANGVIEQKKVALDLSYYYYQWRFMAESSVGKKAGNNVANGFAEVLWRTPKENLSIYTQLRYQRAEIDHNVSSESSSASHWVAGVEWVNDHGFDVSAQYKHKLKEMKNQSIEPILSVQLRYRM